MVGILVSALNRKVYIKNHKIKCDTSLTNLFLFYKPFILKANLGLYEPNVAHYRYLLTDIMNGINCF